MPPTGARQPWRWNGIGALYLWHPEFTPGAGSENRCLPWNGRLHRLPVLLDANGGVFEPLLDARDAIISDALNHASIIDGVRLCKAQRFRYANNDMADLEQQLQKAGDYRRA